MAEPLTPTLAEIKRSVIDNCIYIIQQSLDTVRAEDDGESRSIKTSIAAREHVIRLLTGYRNNPSLDAARANGLDAAWAEAEAALPLTGWPDGGGRWVLPSNDREVRLRWRESGDGYSEPHYEGWEATGIVYGFGGPDFKRDSLPLEATPAAALRTLAARLKGDSDGGS